MNILLYICGNYVNPRTLNMKILFFDTETSNLNLHDSSASKI